MPSLHLGIARRYALTAATLLFVLGLLACAPERRKSDAELGLNPQQARGRHIFDAECARCHEPYSRVSTQGPSLRAMYRKPYLPSGMPANDERVSEVIMAGKAKMPSFAKVFTQQQIDDLLAYLKTL